MTDSTNGDPHPNSGEPKKTRTIKVDYLARVDGEGALHLQMKDGNVEDAKLKIFEPPRFFEAFLQGRSFREVPDITARIFGTCPVACQMSACNAVEDAAGARLDGRPLRELRSGSPHSRRHLTTSTIGILTAENLGEFLTIQAALRGGKQKMAAQPI